MINEIYGTPKTPAPGARTGVGEGAGEGPVIRNWGTVEEGYLHRLYGLATASRSLFFGEKPLKKLIIKFEYLPANTDEEVEFYIPKNWSEKQIREFEDIVWKLMTIY